MCYVWVPYVIAAVAAAGSVYVQNQNNKKQAKAIQEQINAQASSEADERAREARRERARIRVAAAESGVQGASFESALAQSTFNENYDITKIQDLAYRNENAQLSRYPQQNALGYGLAIGSSLYGTYANQGGSFNRRSETGVQISSGGHP